MQTVWKYQVTLGLTKDTEEKLATWIVDMPIHSKVLSVQSQFGQQVMWVEVETENPLVKRTFKIFATGEDMPKVEGKKWSYISTTQIERGMWTWHLFELTDE
jgi:hypothetical protein